MMKKTVLFLTMLLICCLSCKKAEQQDLDEDDVETIAETRASFYLAKEDQNYWVRNVTIAGKEIGGVVATSFDCGSFGTRYLLTDNDLKKNELEIVLLYNYYPTNNFGRQITFKIPISKFKAGTCTPIEIQQQSAGILQLYIKP